MSRSYAGSVLLFFVFVAGCGVLSLLLRNFFFLLPPMSGLFFGMWGKGRRVSLVIHLALLTLFVVTVFLSALFFPLIFFIVAAFIGGYADARLLLFAGPPVLLAAVGFLVGILSFANKESDECV